MTDLPDNTATTDAAVLGTVRAATPADVPAILDLIHQLAVYEKEPDAGNNTEAMLHDHLFGNNPRVFCHVIDDVVDGDPQVVGIALWFETYSTWEGVHGIWLEDLFVIPAMRGRGYGKALLLHLAQIAVARGYSRYEWSVLRSEEHTSELQSRGHLVCRLLLEKKTHRHKLGRPHDRACPRRPHQRLLRIRQCVAGPRSGRRAALRLHRCHRPVRLGLRRDQDRP